MKLWQLFSFCREAPEVLELVLQSDEWKQFHLAYLDQRTLIDQQKREILDQVLPVEFVVAVLREDETRIFISNGYLRIRPLKADDELISPLNVYLTYGGETLEDVLEYGLVQVRGSPR